MRVVAMVSGGKDSTFNMMQCIAAGHNIVALANLVPHNKTEIDSYMYQSVGHEAIDLIAQAVDLPIFKRETFGVSKKKGKTYYPCENDEVEDLYLLLQEIQKAIEFDAVSVGAILSDYQRVRVENVCNRLKLTPLAYLWQRNQKELLDEMIRCEVDAIVIKVAALGLDPKKHLGRSLSLLQPHLLKMHEKYGLNVCGEGGEYETLTLDCPLFKSRLVVEDSEIIMHQNDPIAPVGFLRFNSPDLEFKLPALSLESRLEGLPLKDSYGYVTEDSDDSTFELTHDDADGDSNDLFIEQEITDSLKSDVLQKSSCGASKEGWLWVAGIQGYSNDPGGALEDAICKLKCRCFLINISNLLLHFEVRTSDITNSILIKLLINAPKNFPKTENALNLKVTLETNSHTLQDICAITLYISDMGQFVHLNEVYIKNFHHVNPPTRACVQVPINCPVMLEALSWKSVENGDSEIDRQTMHVQSISHWAPCNIGPYSQATKIGDFIHLAGQIALVPGNMQLVPGGIKAQSKLAVRHIDRVLRAVDSSVNVRDVVQGVCYVTHSSYIEPARKQWEAKTNNAIVQYVVVTGLPRGALVEWHVWAHKHNNQFEYEERGKCIGQYSIALYRRVNYENNVAAIVCRLDGTEDVQVLNNEIFLETLSYCIEKLKQGHANVDKCVYDLKIFFSVLKIADIASLVEIVETFAERICLAYTFVPVVKLKSEKTFLSISGVRNQ